MHPNVVRFCGVCLRPPLVVTEYYSYGSLYQMLQRARKQLEAKGANQRVCVGEGGPATDARRPAMPAARCLVTPQSTLVKPRSNPGRNPVERHPPHTVR
jgi:hypothetical protein